MGGREGDYVMTPGVDNPFYHHLGKVIQGLHQPCILAFFVVFNIPFLFLFLTLIGGFQSFFTMVRVLSCFFPVPKSQSNGSLHPAFWAMSCRMVEGASPGVCPASGGSSSFGRPPGTIAVG